MGKTLTPEERAAKKAFAVEEKIKEGTGAIRQVWIALAGYLYEFHEGEMWEHLGYEGFDQWLGSPEITQGRSRARLLIQIHKELVVERNIEPATLAGLETSKIAVVLPAIRKGKVDAGTALADCEALSRNDLRERYGKSVPAERVPLIQCEDCGCMKRPKTEAEVAEPIPGQMSTEEANAA